MRPIVLIGFGAIGSAIHAAIQTTNAASIIRIIETPARVAKLQATATGDTVFSASIDHQTLPQDALIIECAEHAAVKIHLVPALQHGYECGMLSIGALADPTILAAIPSNAKLHLLAGAIGAIDALRSASFGKLQSVSYSACKPPMSWSGTQAQQQFDLAKLNEKTLLFHDTARNAALAFPKNANVTASVALAGIGLDATVVRLYADPNIRQNVHTIDAHGDFGNMHFTIASNQLPGNPKTSALTVLSALRFIDNSTRCISQ